MELIRSICPLLSVVTIISGGRSELHLCVKECAWYDSSKNICSVIEIADSLSDVVDRLSYINFTLDNAVPNGGSHEG